MTTQTLERSMMAARGLKVISHGEGESMIPLIEVERDGEVIAFISVAPWDTFDEKVSAFIQCLYAVRSLEGDGIRLLIDAHMSRHSEEEWDSGDRVLPSQDPKAVDVILGYEWKDGQSNESMYDEYHILDDGSIEWKGMQTFPTDAVESWMHDAVAAAYENDAPVEEDVNMLAAWMDEKGHTLILRSKP